MHEEVLVGLVIYMMRRAMSEQPPHQSLPEVDPARKVLNRGSPRWKSFRDAQADDGMYADQWVALAVESGMLKKTTAFRRHTHASACGYAYQLRSQLKCRFGK